MQSDKELRLGWRVGQKAWRCNLNGADTQYPSSCNTCDICIDSDLRNKFRLNERNRTNNCDWVARNPCYRCKIAGIFHTCRETCGQCQESRSLKTSIYVQFCISYLEKGIEITQWM